MPETKTSKRGRVTNIAAAGMADPSHAKSAGWARTTNLDELASLYHQGGPSFFTDWQDFTETSTPVVVNRSPRIILIARSFEGRTRSALEFLRENGLPVVVVPVTVYEVSWSRT